MEIIIEELKNVFYLMYVSYIEIIKIDYKLKSVFGTWFNQWKEGGDYNASPTSKVCYDEAFLVHFFPSEIKVAKVGEFLTLKQDSLSVH